MASIVHNISGSTLSLPYPYRGVLHAGASAVLPEDTATVIANLGGATLVTGVFDVQPAPAGEPVTPQGSLPVPGISPVTIFSTEVALLASTPSDGAEAYAQDTDVFWFRRNGAWSATPNPAGGGGGGVTLYTTEALLLAATPADGTLGYAQDTDRYWFRRSALWELRPNLSAQTANITFPIDYATGTDPIPGTIFTSTADVTAYLTAHGQTYFKTIMGCFDALPDICPFTVIFSLQPGVHRPRAGEPSGAFFFRPVGNRRFPIFLGTAAVNIVAAAPTAAASWETIVAAQSCTAATTSNPSNGLEVKLDFAGTPFTSGALKGYFARIDTATPQHIVIRDNTASSLYLNASYGTSPVGVNVTVVSPSTIIRNSLDDLTAAYTTFFTISGDNSWFPIAAPTFTFDTVRLDHVTATGSSGVFNIIGAARLTLNRVLNDQARLKDLGLPQAGHATLSGGASQQAPRITMTSCSVRGLRFAAVPASDSAAAVLTPGGLGQTANGSLSLNNCFLGGLQRTGGGIQATGFVVSVSGCCFDTFLAGGAEFIYCQMSFNSTTPKNFMRNFTSVSLRLTNSKCGTISSLVFETFNTVCAVLIGATEAVFDNILAGAAGGLTAALFSVTGPNAKIRFARVLATTTFASGDLTTSGVSGAGLTGFITDFKKRWEIRDDKADFGTLYNAVRVVRVGDYDGTGTVTNPGLRWTVAGTTLEFHSPVDGAGVYGAAVDVSAGGRFTLFGSTTSTFIVVDVVPTLMPGSDTVATLHTVMRALRGAEVGDEVAFSLA